ncbi:MAG: CoA transferase [Chloroflexi bacterium]|nr:CoA transferase [Chloroflexota bacterium]
MFALQGVKIVDLTNYIAGSYCCMLLADMGADVIKVETPEGDPFREIFGFYGWNRGKRAMVLDLKQPEGKAVLLELVKQSDVVVENYRPGVADRLGIGHENLKQVNPRIIYTALSAWGQTGPYRDRPGFDPLMQALGGVMAAQGGPAGPPVFNRVAVSDYTAAFLGAYGTAVALYVREKTGIGQRVDSSLLNAVIAIQSGWFVRGAEPKNLVTGVPIPYQLFQTADDWMFVACGNQTFWVNFCKALRIESLIDDPRFALLTARLEHREELLGILQEILLTNSTDEWVSLLLANDVPCAPVKQLDELFDDPQVRHNEMVVEYEHPDAGKMWQMGVPIKLSETPGRVFGPPPVLGQHTVEVLAELGYSPDRIEVLRRKKVV